jgi:hypothetical protein
MSVFLRWGVFGILGVAALLYAYNASKRLAEAHAAKSAPVAATEPETDATEEAGDVAAEPETAAEVQSPPQSAPAPVPAASADCEAELVVAQRAIDLRKEGAPLDRAMRMQEIAWESSPERRQRLEQVATRWFGYEGDFRPEALRIAVINDCARAAPAR